ncbi:MAG: restriction endonuclease subunit S [Microcystis aeruginosa Ma_MB_F_20061100_S20]|nr:MAG: restriction endonuclease subunit S [Microcystis aeruginosa Ma_MB_F_20061100_S20]
MKESTVFPILPLGKICILHSGGTPRRSNNKYYGGNIPWAKIADLDTENGIVVDTEEYITVEGLQAINNRIFPKGSILLAMYGSIGKLAIAGRDISCNQAILGIQIKDKEHLDINYLRLWLTSIRATLEFQGRGVTQQNISKSIVEKLKIPLPPLEEQRRIAAILDKADGVRRKRKEAIRLTEELLKSTFLDQNVCNRVTDGTHQPPHWVDGGIPFLFVSNIVNGEIDFKVSKHITEESWFELTSRCPIEINDILYTTVGSYGNAALVRTKNRFCFQRHIAHIKPDSRSIEPEFLLGMMQSDWIRQQADKQARGVAQKTLNLRELKKFTIFTPPIEEQKKYVKLRQGVEKQLSYYRSALEQSENLFNSLLQRAFRGEL